MNARKAQMLLAEHLRGVLPTHIEESVVEADVDTAENRFVKNFIDYCLAVVERMRHLRRPAIETSCREIEGVLRPLARAPMWQTVGPMVQFPSGSTTLQRRHDYRAVLQAYTNLRLGSRVPLTREASTRLLEVKDVALLYEVWSCFAMPEAIKARLGPPAHVAQLEATPLELRVPWLLQAKWSNGVELSYNPSFSRSRAGEWRSTSLPLRPDNVLKIPAGPNAGLHVFDAKFKLDRLDSPDSEQDADADEEGLEQRGTFKRGDLYKMHTYRDALVSVRSCWVLYPGSELRFFPEQGGPPVVKAEALPERLAGVGGCPLPPHDAGESLRKVVVKLLTAER